MHDIVVKITKFIDFLLHHVALSVRLYASEERDYKAVNKTDLQPSRNYVDAVQILRSPSLSI